MISIILPTYNEAGNLKSLVSGISKALVGVNHEIIVVDDNSPDKTWQLAQKLKTKFKQLRLIRRVNNRGLTSALNDGIKASRGEIVGWLDADLSHPPELLPSLFKAMKSNDAVVASRYLHGALDDRGLWLQVRLSRIINKICQRLLDNGLTDFTSGYILLKKSYFKKLKLKGDYGEYFIRLIADLISKEAVIKEVPYINVNRVYGESKTATNLWGFAIRGLKYLSSVFDSYNSKSGGIR